MARRTQPTQSTINVRKLTTLDLTPLLKRSRSGIQVNRCKNTACAKFGIRGRAANYVIAASGTLLECISCGQPFSPIGNTLVEEEIYRLRPRGCPEPTCPNHTKPLSTPKAFSKWGRNSSGTSRLRCLACGTSFSIDEPEPRRNDNQAARLMTLLMNKTPLTRACEQLNIDHTQLYRTLVFIERRAVAFANRREQALPRTLWDVFNLSTDRQSHSVNWSSKKDRRNATVWATATCDNDTGYCLLVTMDFDLSVDQDGIELQAAYEFEELSEPPPLRKTGRFWLEHDLPAAKLTKRDIATQRNLSAMVTQGQLSQNQANWIEQTVFPDGSGRLPQRGALVRPNVHFYAHAYLLGEMLHPDSHVRLYLDREPGLAAAMSTAFSSRIKAMKAEAFHVSTLKDATIETKRAKVLAARLRLKKRVKANPEKKDSEVLRDMLMEAWTNAAPISQSAMLWAVHPAPSLQEPEKKVCWLTHRGYDVRALKTGALQVMAKMLSDASLRGTDVFFMQARRRVSMLERPMHSASNAGRTWNGYGAYNPAVLVRLFNIFRVWKNFAIVGDRDGKTPAMRMGLAKAAKSALQILRDE